MGFIRERTGHWPTGTPRTVTSLRGNKNKRIIIVDSRSFVQNVNSGTVALMLHGVEFVHYWRRQVAWLDSIGQETLPVCGRRHQLHAQLHLLSSGAGDNRIDSEQACDVVHRPRLSSEDFRRAVLCTPLEFPGEKKRVETEAQNTSRLFFNRQKRKRTHGHTDASAGRKPCKYCQDQEEQPDRGTAGPGTEAKTPLDQAQGEGRQTPSSERVRVGAATSGAILIQP